MTWIEIIRADRSFQERFWGRVRRGGEGECWPWIGWRGSTVSAGGARTHYGLIYLPETCGRNPSGTLRIAMAHRVAWAISSTEQLAPRAVIRHRCDNPPCCNPRHLIAGTRLDNIRDRDDRGRQYGPRGEDHHRAKLRPDDVRVIRERLAAGETGKALAREYGVTETAISSIKRGHSWKSVVEVE
jgi:hypothetical protein